MKKTKIRSACVVLLIILLLGFFSATLSTRHVVTWADAQSESKAKIHCRATIDDNFTDDSVIVVLDSKISEVNKLHNAKFFDGT